MAEKNNMLYDSGDICLKPVYQKPTLRKNSNDKLALGVDCQYGSGDSAGYCDRGTFAESD